MEAFRIFYHDNREKLYGYLLRRIGRPHDAADLCQEAFVRYLEVYRDRELNVALLFTIGRNLCYDRLRTLKRRREVEESAGDRAADSSGQEDVFAAREEAALVLKALQQLGEEERDLLALVVGSEMSYQDIARITNCTVANVKVKVHRARKRLRSLLQGK